MYELAPFNSLLTRHCTGRSIANYLLDQTQKLDCRSYSTDPQHKSLLLPPAASASNPCPLVWIMTGFDGWRTDLAGSQQGWLF